MEKDKIYEAFKEHEDELRKTIIPLIEERDFSLSDLCKIQDDPDKTLFGCTNLLASFLFNNEHSIESLSGYKKLVECLRQSGFSQIDQFSLGISAEILRDLIIHNYTSRIYQQIHNLASGESSYVALAPLDNFLLDAKKFNIAENLSIIKLDDETKKEFSLLLKHSQVFHQYGFRGRDFAVRVVWRGVKEFVWVSNEFIDYSRNVLIDLLREMRLYQEGHVSFDIVVFKTSLGTNAVLKMSEGVRGVKQYSLKD